MADLSLYFHTLKYLKPIQIYRRIWYRFYRPAMPAVKSLSVRKPLQRMHECAARSSSQVDVKTFRFLNCERTLSCVSDWNNPNWEKLWLYNLHYFDDLNAINSASRSHWHKALIEAWIAENPPLQGAAWEPYTLSLRIVNWVKYFQKNEIIEPGFLLSLCQQVRHLYKIPEYHILGNHLFANAKAFLFAGLFFDGAEADKWLKKGLAILDDQLPEQILDDGGHFELSPMYHALLTEDMLDLLHIAKCYDQSAVRKRLPLWRQLSEKMLDYLQNVTHPDGGIAFFNDAAFAIAPDYKALSDYACVLEVITAPTEISSRLIHMAESGYVRVQRENCVALLDVAKVGPDYLPGHAHADTLSFELSLFGYRVFVNSGTSCYGTDAERQRQRSTAAHNTVAIKGENSSEVWGGFRVARRAYPQNLLIEERDTAVSVHCAHNGYQFRSGIPTHSRQWLFSHAQLTLTDQMISVSAQSEFRLHLHPSVEVKNINDDHTITLCIAGMHSVSIGFSQGDVRLIDSTWHPEFGKSVPNKCISVLLQADTLITTITW